jgi:hypothetical protein
MSLELIVSNGNTIFLQTPHLLRGSCTIGAKVTICSNSEMIINPIIYDRGKTPLNTWECLLTNVQEGSILLVCAVSESVYTEVFSDENGDIWVDEGSDLFSGGFNG